MIILVKALKQLFENKSEFDPVIVSNTCKMPTFDPKTNSLLKQFLTEDVWNQLKDKKDDVGFTFLQCINSGAAYNESGVGVYAGSASSYVVFAPLLDKIIEKYHGHKPSDKHDLKGGWDVNRIPSELLDPESKYIKSTRIRIARNADGYPFGTMISKAQRRELEAKAVKAFNTFEGDLKGKYYSLTKMTPAELKGLQDDHFMFQEPDRFIIACGLARDWPDARGIFHNNDKSFLIWLNEEDQFRIISMENGGDIRKVFGRLGKAANHISSQVKFAENDHLGGINTCPTNCGTGLRASVHVKLPLLSQDKKRFEEIAAKHNVQIRGTGGEHTESKGGVYDVSNKRRLGFNEAALVLDMYNGVKEMIATERELEKQK